MNNWKKRFAVIWAGQLFSILSSNAAQFAIVLWISLKTGSAEALSFAAIAALLPQMTLKVFSGYAVSGESDRDPVRRGNAGWRPFTALLQKRIEASVTGRVFLLFDSISLSVCWRPDFSPTRWVSPRFSHSADSLRL